MNILLVEDDDLQVELLCEDLQKAFAQAPRVIRTESEFISNFDEILKNPPDIIIIDLMLRWTLPSPDFLKPPKEAEDNHTAGFRCKKMLLDNERTRSIPVILYTVFDREDHYAQIRELREPVNYLQKYSNPLPLIKLIRELTTTKKE